MPGHHHHVSLHHGRKRPVGDGAGPPARGRTSPRGGGDPLSGGSGRRPSASAPSCFFRVLRRQLEAPAGRGAGPPRALSFLPRRGGQDPGRPRHPTVGHRTPRPAARRAAAGHGPRRGADRERPGPPPPRGRGLLRRTPSSPRPASRPAGRAHRAVRPPLARPRETVRAARAL